MSTDFALDARNRVHEGKGASRRLRRLEKSLPAIVYGAGKPAKSIALITKDFIKQLENEAFFAHIIKLSIDGEIENVVLKDIQRHPVSNWPVHADFLRVDETHKITMKVPLHFVNEETCAGVKTGGGTINHLTQDIEINCLAKDLPEFIEVDVANLEVGDSIHISEITLPGGVEAVALSHGEDSTDIALVTVLAPKGSSGSEDEDAAAEVTE